MNTTAPFARSHRLVLLTCLLFALGPVTVDLSLPALPAIQQAIGSIGERVELTLTAVLLGMAIGQFLTGPVADAYGRKLPLMIGLAAYSAAALACAFAPNLTVLAVARFIQALGLGVAVVMARSVVADAFDGRDLARVFSTAVMAAGVATVLAPLAGGQLLVARGWRAVFESMAVVGILTAVYVLFCVGETLPPPRRSRTAVAHILGTYFALLRNPAVSSCALIASCAAAAQFAYNTGAPAALIEHHGLSPSAAGAYMAVIALTMAVCSQLNGWLLRWLAPVRILSWAVPAALIGALLTLLVAFSGAGGVNGIAATLLLDLAVIGFIIPNALAVCMMSAGAHAGAASALIGVLMFGLGTIGSAAVGSIHDPSGLAMAAIISLWAVLGLYQFIRLRRLPFNTVG